jgi:hypothetical protein
MREALCYNSVAADHEAGRNSSTAAIAISWLGGQWQQSRTSDVTTFNCSVSRMVLRGTPGFREVKIWGLKENSIKVKESIFPVLN